MGGKLGGMVLRLVSGGSGDQAASAVAPAQPSVASKGKAKPVHGVLPGVFSLHGSVVNACALSRALPDERETREGGFRDAIEAMAVALLAQGVNLRVINAATEVVLDAYSNDN